MYYNFIKTYCDEMRKRKDKLKWPIKGCSRCKNCKCICLFCNKNATEENFQKLEKHALEVNNCSRFVSTATEDTLMPMIKFAILFPLIMSHLSQVKDLKIESVTVNDIKKNMNMGI